MCYGEFMVELIQDQNVPTDIVSGTGLGPMAWGYDGAGDDRSP